MENAGAGNIKTKQPNGRDGWFFGNFPDTKLPYPWNYGAMEMKWAELQEGVDSGGIKPEGATTISILVAGGPHQITLYSQNGNQKVHHLVEVGDFVFWGPTTKHSWRAVGTNTTITFRWKGVPLLPA